MDDATTPGDGGALAAAFVAAYEPFVRARLADADLDGAPGLPDAMAEGRSWLQDALDALLSRPFAQQRRSPLEVFQEAMRFPSAALEAAGVVPAPRDPGAEAALPGDRYDLAPASSQDLGEAAWEAHLAWGAAKAQAVAPEVTGTPGVVYLGRSLMDRTRIEQAATAAGLELAAASSVADMEDLRVPRPVVALVDLEHPDADEAVRRLAGAGVKVIAFGPHVDDLALARAGSLGADQALPRSRFFRRLDEILPRRV